MKSFKALLGVLVLAMNIYGFVKLCTNGFDSSSPTIVPDSDAIMKTIRKDLYPMDKQKWTGNYVNNAFGEGTLSLTNDTLRFASSSYPDFKGNLKEMGGNIYFMDLVNTEKKENIFVMFTMTADSKIPMMEFVNRDTGLDSIVTSKTIKLVKIDSVLNTIGTVNKEPGN